MVRRSGIFREFPAIIRGTESISSVHRFASSKFDPGFQRVRESYSRPHNLPVRERCCDRNPPSVSPAAAAAGPSEVVTDAELNDWEEGIFPGIILEAKLLLFQVHLQLWDDRVGGG